MEENGQSDVGEYLLKCSNLKSICSDLKHTYRGAASDWQNVVGVVESCFGSIQAARVFDLELLYLFSKVNEGKCIYPGAKILKSVHISWDQKVKYEAKAAARKSRREEPLECKYCNSAGNKKGVWTLTRLMDHERSCAVRLTNGT